jgi:hypothetical protein
MIVDLVRLLGFLGLEGLAGVEMCSMIGTSFTIIR